MKTQTLGIVLKSCSKGRLAQGAELLYYLRPLKSKIPQLPIRRREPEGWHYALKTCPYCGREFWGGAHSRAGHANKCPAKRLIPNNIESLRIHLQKLRHIFLGIEKGSLKPISKGEAKFLVKQIDDVLSFD